MDVWYGMVRFRKGEDDFEIMKWEDGWMEESLVYEERGV